MYKNSNMKLEVSFLAGTSIEEAAKEAKEKAIQFNVCYVTFNFNNTKVSISQHANIQDVLDEFNEKLPVIVS